MIKNRGLSPSDEELEFLFGCIRRGLIDREILEEIQDTEFPPRDSRTYRRLRREFAVAVKPLKGDGGREVVSPEQVHKEFLVSGIEGLRCPEIKHFPPLPFGGDLGAVIPSEPLATRCLRVHLGPDHPVLLRFERTQEMLSEWSQLCEELFAELSANVEKIANTTRGKIFGLNKAREGIVFKLYDLVQQKVFGEIPDPLLDRGVNEVFVTLTTNLVQQLVSILDSYRKLAQIQEEAIQLAMKRKSFRPGICEVCESFGGIS